jgi:hypothetical protein
MTNKKRITNAELTAIRERSEKAIGEQWTNFDDAICEDTTYVMEYDSLTETGVELIAECKRNWDSEFIAHAREDVPKLLAEVERLKEAAKRVDYVIYTERATRNHMEMTEEEKAFMRGLSLATSVIRRFFPEISEVVEEEDEANADQ